MKAVLVVPADAAASGFGRYADGLAMGLRANGVEVEMFPVPRHRFRLGPLYLGHTLQRLVLHTTHRPPRDGDTIVHAVQPMFATDRVDVVTVHDAIPFQVDLGGVRGALNDRYLQSTLHRLGDVEIVAPTHAVERDLVDLGLDAERITVTYEGVDAQRFHPDEPHPDMDRDGFHVLMVGDLNPRKRWHVVLEAARDLHDVHVWHAGTFDARGDEAVRLGPLWDALGDRMHRLPRVDDAELRRLYSGCDLFVLPSRAEGFGLPPLEALACGARVLVSDIPVFREVLGDAVEYAEGTVDAFREALERATGTDGPSTREQRLAHAHSYTWEAAARRTLDAYERAAP